jgi:energy-coupling factor transporter ATP-binding protein EcfA2
MSETRNAPFIEYEKAGSLDDVVVVLPDRVDAYQVKHAVSDNAVYVTDDLTNPDSVVFVDKFAKSWKKLVTEFPGRQLSIYLRSNRALDAQLAEVVTGKGLFDDKFRENRYRKERRELRAAIFESTGLSEQEFQQFLVSFHFDLKRLSWLNLERHIQAVMLDHKLGISDRRIFADLKRLVEHHAIEVADPITPQIIDSFLRETQTRYLLPQSFFVDDRFVKPPTLQKQLDDQLSKADGEYVVVTGPPGSGKSTALTEYCDGLEKNASNRFIVVRYYCFVRVHDNRQRLRLESKSLRFNLLTALQRRFQTVLDDRRFDFGEDRLHEAFERVARHCGEERKKLVVLLDGLDHVERDDEIRDSVISALPAEIPENVVLLIGTQELNRWTPIALKKGREQRHIEMPLFSRDETRTYVVDRCGIAAPHQTLDQVFAKSAGLPLYLRYLAEMLSSSDDYAATIESIPAAADGDVRSYYETLWAGFDADGRTDARYLSSVLASLRFRVHEDELRVFQIGIPDAPRFEAAYRRVRHLLRRDNALISIFHNSFRVFVLERRNVPTLREIADGILSRLKQEELQSVRWFKHAFRYALEAGDFHYILRKVNRGFVDAALGRFRSDDEIKDGIECAIEAAEATKDLVALSRLGSLKYRTHERLEHTFPRSVLTDILLYDGRVDQVVDSIYSEESDRVVAGEDYSLRIMLKLVDLGMNELGEKLFSAFLKNFRNSNKLGKNGIVALARCAGVFTTRQACVMRWLSGTTLQRDILEPEELAAGYAPHLAAYLDGLVHSGRDNVWKKLKRLDSPFSNQLMRQLTIRAIANWRSVDEIRSEIQEYVANHEEDTNIELAFYAARAGLPAPFVNRLAGYFDFPPEAATHKTSRVDLQSQILRFAYWAVVIGYEQNDDIVRQLRVRVRGSEAVWACAQLHLLQVGQVLGSHFADRNIDWFSSATEAVEALENAGHAAGERTSDALDAVRTVLDRSLRWLSDVILQRCQDKIADWTSLLMRLRNSFIWTCHYGWGEAETNYSFEFPIWEKQAELPGMRGQLRPVFVSCAKSYDEALSLKGGLRGHHFLMLAALAAKCGFKSDSSVWSKRGIETTLAYGYSKDVTLKNLTDVLTLLGKHRPERVLPSAAAILEIIKWVRNATDGRSTKHFAQYLLPTITTHNRAAALEVLCTYYEQFARWQADESMTKYILARDNGDPEFLWALCGLLDPNESLEPRQHVAALAASIDPNFRELWAARLSDYIRTMINPRHWPDELWEKATRINERPLRRQRDEGSSHGP